MTRRNPVRTEARNGAEFNNAGAQNLDPPTEYFNSPDPARRKRLLSLGVELHHRGSRPVGEFISELADISSEVADEIELRLETYCRIPAEVFALPDDVLTPANPDEVPGRQSVSYWLERAIRIAPSNPRVAIERLQYADGCRRTLGLTWRESLCVPEIDESDE